MDKIRIAVAGVGNCASALIQGIEYYGRYATASKTEKVPGLMYYDLGGYRPQDVEVVAAFDIDKRKIGRPLREAIFALPNCTKIYCPNIKNTKVVVQMGEPLDGVAPHMHNYPDEQTFLVATEKPVNAAKVLRDSGAEILLNYLPVGSEEASRYYAEACLQAGVAFINCIPVFIASDLKWARKFEEQRLPIVGDDIKAQMGATIVHRALTRLFEERGVKLEQTYQLNTGGNTDFLNMLNRERLRSKKISKTEAVQSQLEVPLPPDKIHIGPSDHVAWQKDNKICFLRMEGTGFGGLPLHLELRLSVEDSPNSGGVSIDVIRCCKLALNRGTGGPLTSIAAYTMKHPPIQYPDSLAKQLVNDFILGKQER